ncbi:MULTISPECIES: hypothetical protein [Streptomyces]|uniref:hypothetical protein n=1 Tax=Streptomyces TaxID=1883 RepID=UPI002248858E|nr:hypothetical protein [Streptomyces sp. JHD 1]MCX2971627.1 hypothetical protein [Streptomyces sp. JHD 1]
MRPTAAAGTPRAAARVTVALALLGLGAPPATAAAREPVSGGTVGFLATAAVLAVVAACGSWLLHRRERQRDRS